MDNMSIMVVFVCISWILLAPTACWLTYALYQHRRNIMIQKREPSLTLFYCLLVILILLFQHPIWVLSFAMNDKANATHNNTLHAVIFYVDLCGYYLLVCGASWIMLLRYWIIYYHVQWARSTLNEEWKIHINHLNVKKDWFLSHKATFGNTMYCLKRLCIVYVLIVFIGGILYNTVSSGVLFNSLLVIILNIGPLFVVFLFWKMRKFRDSFHIIKEFRYMTYMLLFMYLVYTVFAISLYSLHPFTRTMIEAALTSIYYLASLYLQTLYVLNMIKKDNSLKPQLQIYNHSISEMSSNSSRSLSEVFKNQESLELFIQHLIKEFSLELILSFVEFTQFAQSVKQHYNDENVTDKADDMKLTELQQALLSNTQLIRSYIVYHEELKDILNEFNILNNKDNDYSNDMMISFKIRAYALYLKYVENGELQINISYEQKQKLYELMSNLNGFINNVNMKPKEMFSLYSDVLLEITKLLRWSYARFN